ncbi:hypothetical protein IHE61_19950 [Streptomyces sp. GKU 257-1]|nr:hypothetical protein [Streptomyces sp. GKU 257-1]
MNDRQYIGGNPAAADRSAPGALLRSGRALRIRLLERDRQPLAGQPGEECRSPRILAEKMTEAHEAWRRSLAGTSLAGITDRLPPSASSRTRLRLTGTP